MGKGRSLVGILKKKWGGKVFENRETEGKERPDIVKVELIVPHSCRRELVKWSKMLK